jgi:dihydroorotase
MYDILIRGGRLIDPLNGIDGRYDVGIAGTKVTRVGEHLDPAQARQVFDATGLVVTPGLIDMHVHVHWGVSHYGIEADQSCLARGVTTAVDAGSAGAYTYPSLKRWIIDQAQTELYAFLNIAYLGMIGDQVGELEDERFIDEPLALRVVQAPEILGIKVRLDRVGRRPATEPLARALAVAEQAGKPVMVHIGSAQRMNVPLDAALNMLRPGDIVTHMYHGKDGGLVDVQGQVRASVWAARERGVLFDLGHGAGSFSFAVARSAVEQGFLPDVLSSDLHTYSLWQPVVDLAMTLCKFMHLGMSLYDVIQGATGRPAEIIGQQRRIGHLGEGADADVAVFRVEQGEYAYVDSEGHQEIGTQRLVPILVLKRGTLAGQGPASAPGLLTLR